MNNPLMQKITPIVCAVVLLTATFFGGVYMGREEYSAAAEIPGAMSGAPSSAQADFSSFWKAWRILDSKFVSASSTKKVSDQDRIWGAISGMVAAAGDPYTVFFPPEEKKVFEEDIRGNFEGVGMEVGLKEGIISVISPLKGTPASKAGILAGDKILSINGSTTQNMAIDDAVNIMRGPKGTAVHLVVLHPGAKETKEITILRDTIDIPTIDTETKVANGKKVFVIHLYNFSSISANLFRNALREFVNSKTDKLVIDLRGNPGGYLEAAQDIASWFLPAGKVVVRENFGPGKEEEVVRSKGYNIFNDQLKMVVLMDRGSASASEILAGALKEHGVAQLVGDRSYGKGSVQELIEVTPETSLKVTIARWLTPNGLSISLNGLTPDVAVPMTAADVAAGNDLQMNKALELLTK